MGMAGRMQDFFDTDTIRYRIHEQRIFQHSGVLNMENVFVAGVWYRCGYTI
jgi:hypothetical protein